jgi:hypothetical protein
MTTPTVRSTFGMFVVLALALAPGVVAQVTTVGGPARATSIAIGADGLGLITYYDPDTTHLMAAHCEDAACTSVTTVPVDTAAMVGSANAVTLGSDGLPLIAYYDEFRGDLKVAHCANAACTTATITPVDTTGNVGTAVSVAVGQDGLGIVAYGDATNGLGNGAIKIAHCQNLDCSSATVRSLDSPAWPLAVSIAIGGDGRGVIGYFRSSHRPQVAHCADVTCTSATVVPLDGASNVNVAPYIGVAKGSDGLPIVSYTLSRSLKVAHCTDAGCASVTRRVAFDAQGGSAGEIWANSITIGGDGRALVAFYEGVKGRLWVAHCTTVVCDASTAHPLDQLTTSGWWNAIATGTDGLGLIAYSRPSQPSPLKAAHCWSADCYAGPQLADPTGDGTADVVLREAAGPVRLMQTFFSNTVSSFRPSPWPLWEDGFVSYRYDLWVVDVTGDRRADLVSLNRDTGDVDVFASDDTRFNYVGRWSYGWEPAAYDLAFADVTGDGRADLVARVKSAANAGSWSVGDVYVFPSTGGTFDSATSSLWSYGWSMGYDLYFGDVDADGRVDLVGRYFGPAAGLTGDVYVALSTGSAFVFNGRWTYGFSSGYELSVADIDGDRRADLIARYVGSGEAVPGDVYVMRSTGSAYSWMGNYAPWISGIGAGYDTLFRDVDSDGRADLIARDRSSGNVWVAPSTATAFAPASLWATGVSSSIDLR